MNSEIDELKELRKEFIRKNVEEKDIKELIKRISKFCAVDENGYVSIFNADRIKLANRILLVLTARYLANKLQEKLGEKITIFKEVSNKELSQILRKKINIINARLSELYKNSMIIKVRNGVYEIAPYKIEEFLEELEKKGEKNG